MSTRSQIRFVQGERSAQVYRHSDGYPSSIIPSLINLMELQHETMSERGPSYVAANYILLGKLGSLRMYEDEIDAESFILDPASELEQLGQPYPLLGYGVEDTGGIHGDEEFLYVVEIPEGRGNSEWTVKMSKDFPRWDEDTEHAFEEASWQFIGPVTEAADELY